MGDTGKLQPQSECFLFIGTGTASRRVLRNIQKKIEDEKSYLDLGDIELRFLALDTNRSVARFAVQHGMEHLLLGPKKLRGEGASGDPEKGREAFEESKDDFVRLVKHGSKEDGQEYRVLGAFVVAFGATGGTSPGSCMPICQTLKDLSITTVPALFMPSIKGHEGGLRQRNIARELRAILVRTMKVSLFDRDWVYCKAASSQQSVENDLEAELDKIYAEEIVSLFEFYLTSEYLDPSVLRDQVLNGGGCIKMASAELDLEGSEPNQVVADALKIIFENRLHQYVGTTTAVVTYRSGKWTHLHKQALNVGLHDFVTQKGSLDHEYVIRDAQLEKSRGVHVGKGRLTVLLSSEYQEGLEDQFGAEARTAKQSPRKALAASAVAIAQPVTASFKQMVRDTLNRKESSSGWEMLLGGNPYELHRQKAVSFEVTGPRFGQEVLSLLNELVQLRTLFTREQFDFSSDWMNCTLVAAHAYLRENDTCLPRKYSRTRDIPFSDPSKAQTSSWFAELGRKDPELQSRVLASLLAVDFWGMETSRYLLEPVDPRGEVARFLGWKAPKPQPLADLPEFLLPPPAPVETPAPAAMASDLIATAMVDVPSQVLAPAEKPNGAPHVPPAEPVPNSAPRVN